MDAGAPLAGAASSSPFRAVAGIALFDSGVSQEGGAPAAPDRSEGRGDVLGSRLGSPTVPPAAQLSPMGPIEDAEGGGPALAIIAALAAATLALVILAHRLARAREAPDGPPSPPAERDPREWEPPPPPWSRK